MATLEKIRKRSVILVAVIGIALLAFIIGDFLNSGSTFFNQSKMNVVTVDDESVKIDKFQSMVDDLSEIYKSQTGNSQVSEEVMEQLRQTTFETIVRERILDEQAEKLGLAVTSKELTDLVLGENPHPIVMQNLRMFFKEDGTFDRENFKQFLNSLNQTPQNAQQAEQIQSAKKFWMFWENRIKYSQLEMKYVTLLQKAVVVNDLQAQLAFDNRKSSVDLAYVVKPFSAIADSTITVSDKEISELYNKEKENYKQKNETRDIKYIVFSVKPSEADYEKVSDWMNKNKEEFTTSENVEDLLNTSSDVPFMNYHLSKNDVDVDFRDFAFASEKGACTDIITSGNVYKMARVISAKTMAPDSVRISIIPVYAASDDATATLADSLLGVLKGGEDFKTLSEKFNGREIGWVKETGLEKEMIQPCFYGSENLFSVKTSSGTYVMKVEEKTANVEKVQLAILERAVEASSNTFGTYYNEANSFISKNKTAETFVSAAEEAGYSVREFSGLDVNSARLGQLQNSRQIIKWTFESKKGAVSDVFTCEDDFVVAMVDKVNKAGYRSQESVADILKSSIIKDKKAEKLTAELQGKNLETAAAEMNATVDTLRNVNYAQMRTQIGYEPKLVGVAPFKNIGDKGVVESSNGVMLFQVLNKTENQETFDAESEKMQEESKYQYVISQSQKYYDILRDNAEIEDNRARFF